VTTDDLIGRNSDGQAPGDTIEAVLKSEYGCKDVIFLRALPGSGVIEHVDMFLLPVHDGVLLAVYDPGERVFQNYLSTVESGIRDTWLEAASAMAANERHLRSAGVQVFRVPSPLPIMVRDRVVYRTVLNGLVHVGWDHDQHAILPIYKGYQEDVQRDAHTIIEQHFRPGAVDYVEATEAAEGQGAVHCLTLVSPLSGSVFDGSEYQAMSALLKAASAGKAYHGMWEPTGEPTASGTKRRLFISDGQIVLMKADKRVGYWSTGKERPLTDSTFELSTDDGAYDFKFVVDDDMHMTMTIIRKSDKKATSETFQRVTPEHP
jgi:hypothetical protein